MNQHTSSVRVLLVLLAVAITFICGAQAQTPVTISVDPQKTGPTIPADFSGLSFETKLTLVDKDDHRYFRPDNKPLIAMFKQLNIRSLRIGGNSADNPAVAMPSEADIDNVFAFAKAAD